MLECFSCVLTRYLFVLLGVESGTVLLLCSGWHASPSAGTQFKIIQRICFLACCWARRVLQGTLLQLKSLQRTIKTLELVENTQQCFGGIKESEGQGEEIWKGAAGVAALGDKSKVHMLLLSIVFAELMLLLDCEGLQQPLHQQFTCIQGNRAVVLFCC